MLNKVDLITYSTHQILLTQPVKLLKLLRHQKLSTSHSTPDLSQDLWRQKKKIKIKNMGQEIADCVH